MTMKCVTCGRLTEFLEEGLCRACWDAECGEDKTVPVTINTPLCKFCRSAKTIRYGHYLNYPRYFCKACGSKFSDNGAMPYSQYASYIIRYALRAGTSGMSLNQIRQEIHGRYGLEPSSSTVHRWLHKYMKGV